MSTERKNIPNRRAEIVIDMTVGLLVIVPLTLIGVPLFVGRLARGVARVKRAKKAAEPHNASHERCPED